MHSIPVPAPRSHLRCAVWSLWTHNMVLCDCAGERMLCVVQRYYLHLLRMLAVCLDAILFWIMQRHSSQMQQLR